MNNAQAIQDIVNQLQQRQIPESDRLLRLEQFNGGTNNNNNVPSHTAPTPAARELPTGAQPFAIGDQVLITNPRFLQPTGGTITRITPKRITVRSLNGTNIIRAPKNLRRAPHSIEEQ